MDLGRLWFKNSNVPTLKVPRPRASTRYDPRASIHGNPHPAISLFLFRACRFCVFLSVWLGFPTESDETCGFAERNRGNGNVFLFANLAMDTVGLRWRD